MAVKLTVNQINGKRGGEKIKRLYGKDYLREIAARGGRAVVKRYGNAYMGLIGSLGANIVNENLSKTAETKIRRQVNKILGE